MKGNPPPVRSEKKTKNKFSEADLQLFYYEGVKAGLEAAVEVIQKYLLYTSQRAVSWHEVNDAIEAIRALAKAPDGGAKGQKGAERG